MQINPTQKDKKCEKLLKRHEARTLIITAEKYLSVKQRESSFLSSHFLIVTSTGCFARIGESTFVSDEASSDKAIALAIYTPSYVLFLDETLPFYASDKCSVEPEEVFLAFFITPKFSEIMAINGAYGAECFFRMFSPEQRNLSLQLARMLLTSYKCKYVPELFEWVSSQIEFNIGQVESHG